MPPLIINAMGDCDLCIYDVCIWVCMLCCSPDTFFGGDLRILHRTVIDSSILGKVMSIQYLSDYSRITQVEILRIEQSGDYYLLTPAAPPGYEG